MEKIKITKSVASVKCTGPAVPRSFVKPHMKEDYAYVYQASQAPGKRLASAACVHEPYWRPFSR